jgi:hypothetical protein
MIISLFTIVPRVFTNISSLLIVSLSSRSKFPIANRSVSTISNDEKAERREKIVSNSIRWKEKTKFVRRRSSIEESNKQNLSFPIRIIDNPTSNEFSVQNQIQRDKTSFLDDRHFVPLGIDRFRRHFIKSTDQNKLNRTFYNFDRNPKVNNKKKAVFAVENLFQRFEMKTIDTFSTDQTIILALRLDE